MKWAFLMLAVFTGFNACKKEKDEAPVSQTPEELLTAKTWKAEEVRVQLNGGGAQYYKRGATGNTVNYDSDSIRFNPNGTGLYYYGGLQYTTTWTFTDPGKTKLTVVINYPAPITIFLENLHLQSSFMTYSQYVTAGPQYLAAVRRLPN